MEKEDATVEVITDAELCERLRIAPVTMRKYLREGPPRKRHRDAGDIRTIRHFFVGGQRRWVASAVEKFIHGAVA